MRSCMSWLGWMCLCLQGDGRLGPRPSSSRQIDPLSSRRKNKQKMQERKSFRSITGEFWLKAQSSKSGCSTLQQPWVWFQGGRGPVVKSPDGRRTGLRLCGDTRDGTSAQRQQHQDETWRVTAQFEDTNISHEGTCCVRCGDHFIYRSMEWNQTWANQLWFRWYHQLDGDGGVSGSWDSGSTCPPPPHISLDVNPAAADALWSITALEHHGSGASRLRPPRPVVMNDCSVLGFKLDQCNPRQHMQQQLAGTNPTGRRTFPSSPPRPALPKELTWHNTHQVTHTHTRWHTHTHTCDTHTHQVTHTHTRWLTHTPGDTHTHEVTHTHTRWHTHTHKVTHTHTRGDSHTYTQVTPGDTHTHTRWLTHTHTWLWVHSAGRFWTRRETAAGF